MRSSINGCDHPRTELGYFLSAPSRGQSQGKFSVPVCHLARQQRLPWHHCCSLATKIRQSRRKGIGRFASMPELGARRTTCKSMLAALYQKKRLSPVEQAHEKWTLVPVLKVQMEGELTAAAKDRADLYIPCAVVCLA